MEPAWERGHPVPTDIAAAGVRPDLSNRKRALIKPAMTSKTAPTEATFYELAAQFQILIG